MAKKTIKTIEVPVMGTSKVSAIIAATGTEPINDTEMYDIDTKKLGKVNKELLVPYSKSTFDQRAFIKDYKDKKLCGELASCVTKAKPTKIEMITAYTLFARMVAGYKTKLKNADGKIDNVPGFKAQLDKIGTRVQSLTYTDIVNELVAEGKLTAEEAGESFALQIGDSVKVTVSNCEKTEYEIKEAELKAAYDADNTIVPKQYRTIVLTEAALNKALEDSGEGATMATVLNNILNNSTVSMDYSGMKKDYVKNTLPESLKPYIIKTTGSIVKTVKSELK